MTKYKAEILRPFGPKILKVKLPDEVFNKLVEITDELVVDKNRKSYGQNLAGQIKEEIEITKEVLQKDKLDEFFDMYVRTYCDYCLKELYDFNYETHELRCSLTDMWFNEMKPGGEYNPPHFHTKCFVSSTIYIKVPSNRPKRGIEHKRDKDGHIAFIDRSVAPNFLQRGQISFPPEEGIMYMWPSSLLHAVHPFLGDEVRRSIAWNGVYQLVEKKTNNVIVGL